MKIQRETMPSLNSVVFHMTEFVWLSGATYMRDLSIDSMASTGKNVSMNKTVGMTKISIGCSILM